MVKLIGYGESAKYHFASDYLYFFFITLRFNLCILDDNHNHFQQKNLNIMFFFIIIFNICLSLSASEGFPCYHELPSMHCVFAYCFPHHAVVIVLIVKLVNCDYV